MMPKKAAAWVLSLFCATALVGCVPAGEARSAEVPSRVVELPEANDIPYATEEAEAQVESWEFSEEADLQLPELPTGCEATAASTLLRMNGIEVSKTEFADRMPKNDGEDFVNGFWGDPYSVHGMCIMAPGVTNVVRGFLPVEKTAVDLTGNSLLYLPTPCVVWVTMGMEEPMESEYSQDGYDVLWNTHAVVMTYADEMSVGYIDPMIGPTSCGFSKFDRAYMANGRQAVYICDRGYDPKC